MAKEPTSQDQFGDGGTRRITKDQIDRAKEKPAEKVEKPKDKKD